MSNSPCLKPHDLELIAQSIIYRPTIKIVQSLPLWLVLVPSE